MHKIGIQTTSCVLNDLNLAMNYNFRYLLNPYSIISCAGHSTAVIDNLAVACSLWAGLTGGWGYMYVTIMHIHIR